MLMVNYRGGFPNDEAYLPTLSRGIAYLRSLPGVHQGRGRRPQRRRTPDPVLSERRRAWLGRMQRAEKIYPCQGTELDGLEKADGMVLLDPTLGAFHQMSSVDPAVDGNKRIAVARHVQRRQRL